MSKLNEALRDLGIEENSLPAGIAQRIRKYDRMVGELDKAKEEVGEDEAEKLEQLESEVFEYREDIIASLYELSETRKLKAEQERLKEERKKAREAKKKAKAVKAEPTPKPEPAPEPEPEPAPEPTPEPEPQPAAPAEKPEGEMANASGEDNGEEPIEPEIVEEKSSGIGLGTILIGGLVLLTTFGAYNYFKRR
jgi:TolA-binding protein